MVFSVFVCFFSSFLFFFWFRHAWLLLSCCCVVIHPPPGWRKFQLPSAGPEHSFCGSPWLPPGPGQVRKGKQPITHLPITHQPWPPRQVPHTMCPCQHGITGSALPIGFPVLHLVQTQRTHAMKHLLMWRWRGWHTRNKATAQEDRSGTSCLAPSRLLQGSPTWPLPAQLHTAPSLPGEEREQGLGRLSKAAALVPGDSSHLMALSRGCFGAAWKAPCCLFQHVTPLGCSPPCIFCSWSLACSSANGKASTLRTKCSWSEQSLHAYRRRDLNKEDLHSLQSRTRWAMTHVCILHIHTQKTHTLCMYYTYAHTHAHTETIN